MIHNHSSPALRCYLGYRWLACLAIVCVAVTGCGHHEKSEYSSVAKPPTVRIVHPESRTIVRVVGQPSFIEAYERTSIYPKVTGYIEKWVVDIGDKVKKGDVLAKLFVPELVEDFETKKATVKLDGDRVDLARTMVDVSQADVKSAEASLVESKAILAKFEAEVERWDMEVKRLTQEVNRGVIDPQILLESTNQWKSAAASKDAAKATIMKAEADLLSKQAMLAKAKVDVSVAQSALSVASSEAKRLEAWTGYLTLTAPFDGMIVARNANTFDFVQPSTGDPSADNRAPHLSPSGASAPIYVVDRTDVVRIFVDVPEQDANDVQIGTKATVLVKAHRDEPISGTVTRTAWALNVKSRTLRAEIDLPNPHQRLLPGMYAYAKVITEHPNTLALPVTALIYSGEKAFCWVYKDGHAERTEVRTGVSDGKWIEVTNLQRVMPSTNEQPWNPVSGSEQVILGDLSVLADGVKVDVAPETGEKKVAEGIPTRSSRTDRPTMVAAIP
jgi:multidrug efflux pump subunit AcrA (membrane-fusion protein)